MCITTKNEEKYICDPDKKINFRNIPRKEKEKKMYTTPKQACQHHKIGKYNKHLCSLNVVFQQDVYLANCLFLLNIESVLP